MNDYKVTVQFQAATDEDAIEKCQAIEMATGSIFESPTIALENKDGVAINVPPLVL